MPDNRYITQYIVTGFGHLQKFKVNYNTAQMNMDARLANAVRYLDYMLKKEYDDLLRTKINLEKDNIDYTQI